MARYLDSHDHVTISDPKEPHFFNDDMLYRDYFEQSRYLSLFETSKENCDIVIDASALYLFSTSAVPNILKFEPNAKFIVMLRDPVEMAYSMHSELLSNGQECEHDFHRAWSLMTPRSHGESIPFGTREPKLLQYGELCKTGLQVNRLLEQVDFNQVLFVEFRHFISDPANEYRRVLKFLKLEDMGFSDFVVHNANVIASSRRLVLLSKFINRMKRKLGVTAGIGLLGWLDRVNLVERKRTKLDNQLRIAMRDFFQSDQHLLKQRLAEHKSALTRLG
jgi:hypothetical protein